MQLLHQVGLVTARVMSAMDLPETTTQVISHTLDPATYFGNSSSGGTSAGPATTGWPATLAAWHQQLQWWCSAVGAGLRGFAEGFWLRWGAECVMLLLLAAALVGANAVSLLLLLLVVLGMAMVAAQPGLQQARSAVDSSGRGPSGGLDGQSSNGVSRASSSAGGSVWRSGGVSWWWWHLVLGVLAVALVGFVGVSAAVGWPAWSSRQD